VDITARKQQEDEREFFYRLAHDLARAADIKMIAKHLFAWAKGLLGADCGWLQSADAEGMVLNGVAAYGIDVAAFLQDTIDLRHESVPNALALQTKQPVVVMDLAQSTLVSERSRKKYPLLRSVWIVPLINGEQVMGTLTVGYTRPREAFPAELHLLQLLGDQAALAIGRVRLTEEMQRSEKRFRALIEQSTDAIALLAADGTLLYVSPSGSRMFGRSWGENVGRNALELIHPADLPSITNRFSQILQEPAIPITAEFRYQHQDGSWRWIEAMGQNLLAEPSVEAIVVNYRDVTEHKRAERVLQESEQRYRIISEMISDYAYAVSIEPDYTYTIEWFTETFTRVTGFTLEKGPHSPDTWRPFVHPDDMPIARQRLQKLMSGQTDVSEIRIITKSGETRWIREYGRPVWDEAQGRTTHLYVVGHDITERKQAEEEKQKLQEQLFQARKMEALGTLAGGVAHDFNNILSAIMGFTELATDEVPEGTVARRNLEEVLKASRRAKVLVQQILTFSRPSQPKSEPIQPHPIVEEVLTFLRASLPKTIEIHHDIARTVGPVAISASQLQQVLMNLCVNAIEALGEKGGVLEVHLERVKMENDFAHPQRNLSSSPYLSLTVRDTGCGMTPEVLERIFEPFFTTRPVGKGNGLGLAIVHGIVTGHGGAITVESTLGRGTTFHVYLPVSESPVTSENIVRRFSF